LLQQSKKGYFASDLLAFRNNEEKLSIFLIVKKIFNNYTPGGAPTLPKIINYKGTFAAA
jgi:hypothetical protein